MIVAKILGCMISFTKFSTVFRFSMRMHFHLNEEKFTYTIMMAILLLSALLTQTTIKQNEIWHQTHVFYSIIFTYQKLGKIVAPPPTKKS